MGYILRYASLGNVMTANITQSNYENLFVQSTTDVGYINAYISLSLLGLC